MAVVAVCLVVFAVIARLAAPSSSAIDLTQTTLSPVEIRALAQQATLRVSASACGGVTRGSGVIIDGRLVTNAHIVDGATELKADQPIDPVVVPLISFDLGSDLAAAAQPVGVSLVLATPDAVRGDAILGRSVTLAGHADGGNIEVQTGVVAARVPGGAYGYTVDLLLIEAQTRGGYSGGPVLDDTGNVIAILSGFDRSTGLTLAIPADVVGDFLDLGAAGGLAGRHGIDQRERFVPRLGNSDCGTR